jgi:hypothetical protein
MAYTGEESTVSEFITDYSDQQISVSTLCYKEVITSQDQKIVIPQSSILSKYDPILKEHLMTRTLTEEEVNKYYYNPKRLSYDLYGSVEYWELLLHANQIFSITEFSINPVKVYDQGVLSVISDILNIEKDSIAENTSEIESA